MLIWEMITAADAKRDLANPTVYPLWFHTLFRWKPANIHVEGDSIKADIPNDDNPPPAMGLVPFIAAWDSPDDGLWHAALREMWEYAINALRFAVVQLRKAKTRRNGIDAETARRVWGSYVRNIQIAVRFKDGKFARYQTVATPGNTITPMMWGTLDERQRALATAIDSLFQKAFASLIDGLTADHFCAGCGRAMDTMTPTGRLSRASVCPKCALARWKKKVGPKVLREQWKKDKQRERDSGKKRKTT